MWIWLAHTKDQISTDGEIEYVDTLLWLYATLHWGLGFNSSLATINNGYTMYSTRPVVSAINDTEIPHFKVFPCFDKAWKPSIMTIKMPR